jgi:hypothetical protein
MGRILTVNLDANTAGYVIRLAQQQGVTPSELIRERIYEFFNVERRNKSGFSPRQSYSVRGRIVFHVYLNDQVHELVTQYLRRNNKSIASFVRDLFTVILNV